MRGIRTARRSARESARTPLPSLPPATPPCGWWCGSRDDRGSGQVGSSNMNVTGPMTNRELDLIVEAGLQSAARSAPAAPGEP